MRAAGAKGKRPVDDPLVGGSNGPTQLRQQSYVGQRPGAYWSAPGAAPVRAPAPTPLPPFTAAPEAEAATRSAVPSRRPPQARDPEVLLEAEPVLSILVNATPVPAELPLSMPEPPVQQRRRRLNRRRTVMLLVVVAIAAGAVIAVGVILGNSKSQNSAPTPTGEDELLSSPSAPSPTPTLTPRRAPALAASTGGGESAPTPNGGDEWHRPQPAPTPPPSTSPSSAPSATYVATSSPSRGPTYATEPPTPSPSPDPIADTVCDKYTAAVFGDNTADNQLALMQAIVNLAVLGDDATPGILAPEGGLLELFSGAGPTTNRGGQAVVVDLLDGAAGLPDNLDASSNTAFLLNHLYQFFGAWLGCVADGFPSYEGVADMYEVHKFMNINSTQMNYFVNQVGAAASSLGFTDDDIAKIADSLDGIFNERCTQPLNELSPVPPFLVGTNPSICQTSDCPVEDESVC